MTDNTLLTVRGLSLEVAGSGHRVVKDVSFDIAPGEIFGIVGESGSGKTLATRALISLLPPAIAVTGGSVIYKGRDVMSLLKKGTSPPARRGNRRRFPGADDLSQSVDDDW